MYKQWKDKVEFFIVYIREAHPNDGWQVEPNRREGVVYDAPKTYEERCKIASDCLKDLKLSLPALVDDMNDTAEKAYSGWPDRIFIVTKEGKIGYRGERGPWGFKVSEAVKWLERNVSR